MIEQNKVRGNESTSMIHCLEIRDLMEMIENIVKLGDKNSEKNEENQIK
jgi:hypothetical protein